MIQLVNLKYLAFQIYLLCWLLAAEDWWPRSLAMTDWHCLIEVACWSLNWSCMMYWLYWLLAAERLEEGPSQASKDRYCRFEMLLGILNMLITELNCLVIAVLKKYDPLLIILLSFLTSPTLALLFLSSLYSRRSKSCCFWCQSLVAKSFTSSSNRIPRNPKRSILKNTKELTPEKSSSTAGRHRSKTRRKYCCWWLWLSSSLEQKKHLGKHKLWWSPWRKKIK